MQMNRKPEPHFASDYMEGAVPQIIQRLAATNYDRTPGYGLDPVCESAKRRIRAACRCEGARVEFLVGGTQTNALVISALLKQYQGVLCAETGHIAVHEAGAIEAGGHKVITLPAQNGKIDAAQVESYMELWLADETHEHTVMPGAVYVSQLTECGTLYTLAELEALRAACDKYGLLLYLDGARLAYALACRRNDVQLPDLARLCHAFYIGGTKCGALFGEALVTPDPDLIPHIFTIIKQRGALLAKGRMLGLQFDELFTDELYMRVGQSAVDCAEALRAGLREKGYNVLYDTPANMAFVALPDELIAKLSQSADFSVCEPLNPGWHAVRFVTSWATLPEEVDMLLALM